MSQPPAATASPRPSRAPVLVVLAFFAVAVTLVLIGAQLSASPAPSVVIDRPGTPEQPRALNLIMRDYRFDPTPVVLVKGETVRLTVFNAGLVVHEMSLGDAAVQAAWAAADAAATPPGPFATAPPASAPPGTGGLRLVLGSGAQAVVEYTVPRDERLMLLCNLPGHVAQGMVGVVELRADEGRGPGAAAARAGKIGTPAITPTEDRGQPRTSLKPSWSQPGRPTRRSEK